MKYASRLFALLSAALILVLAISASAITRSLIIQQPYRKAQLTETLSDALGSLAVSRARSLDPDAKWIQVEEGSSQEIQSFIEENVLNSIRSQSDELTRDSNLAWVVTYEGKEYRHNWKDDYSTQEGALDYTIRSGGSTTAYSGYYLPPNSFSRERTILVNPSLVPAERLASSGGDYTYKLLLPSGFAIHYYIPTQLVSNGGEIAIIAADLNQTGMNFSIGCGSLMIAAFTLLYRWKSEQGYRPIRQFTRLKALWAWLILIGGLTGLILVDEQIRLSYSSGLLVQFFHSMGFSQLQADLAAALTSTSLWALYFFLLMPGLLYIKWIQAKGLSAYLRQDTLTSWMFTRYREQILHAFDPEHTRSPEFRLMLIGISIVLFMTVFMIAGALLFQLPGLLIAALSGSLFVCALFWAVYKVQNRNFEKVYHASEQLAKGDFEALQKMDVGIYQPIYDELMHVSDSYETALKEGLASQVTKTQLISNVSHDLKTPIAGIQSYSELIGLSDNIDDIKVYASRLENYAARLNALIEDLFNVARATSGDIQLDLQDIDLSELVMQVSAEWDDTFSSRKLHPVIDLLPNAMIRLDPDKMVRIIENLLSNICKYSLENSRVFISLHQENELYVLMFKNTSKVQMDFTPDQIVERFVRGDASRHESGSGLGLAIVKSFVEVMSGTFEIMTDGDLFKACITFPVPPVPQVPEMPEQDLDQSEPLEKTDHLSKLEAIEQTKTDSLMTDEDTIRQNDPQQENS